MPSMTLPSESLIIPSKDFILPVEDLILPNRFLMLRNMFSIFPYKEIKMQKEEVQLKFKFSQPKLIELCYEKHGFAERDIAEMPSRGVLKNS